VGTEEKLEFLEIEGFGKTGNSEKLKKKFKKSVQNGKVGKKKLKNWYLEVCAEQKNFENCSNCEIETIIKIGELVGTGKCVETGESL